MKGNFHVQFLGEGVAATSPPYPTPGWATTPVYPASQSVDPSPRSYEGRRGTRAIPALVDLGLVEGSQDTRVSTR